MSHTNNSKKKNAVNAQRESRVHDSNAPKKDASRDGVRQQQRGGQQASRGTSERSGPGTKRVGENASVAATNEETTPSGVFLFSAAVGALVKAQDHVRGTYEPNAKIGDVMELLNPEEYKAVISEQIRRFENPVGEHMKDSQEDSDEDAYYDEGDSAAPDEYFPGELRDHSVSKHISMTPDGSIGMHNFEFNTESSTLPAMAADSLDGKYLTVPIKLDENFPNHRFLPHDAYFDGAGNSGLPFPVRACLKGLPRTCFSHTSTQSGQGFEPVATIYPSGGHGPTMIYDKPKDKDPWAHHLHFLCHGIKDSDIDACIIEEPKIEDIQEKYTEQEKEAHQETLAVMKIKDLCFVERESPLGLFLIRDRKIFGSGGDISKQFKDHVVVNTSTARVEADVLKSLMGLSPYVNPANMEMVFYRADGKRWDDPPKGMSEEAVKYLHDVPVSIGARISSRLQKIDSFEVHDIYDNGNNNSAANGAGGGN